jgi:heme/copper-type cytochrome/quinol oxidase subunit 3
MSGAHVSSGLADGDAARRGMQPRRALPNGWWGMAVFLASESTIFGTLIASYFYLRFTSPEWPQGGIAAPSVALPIALTAALVATTVPMAAASAAARRGRVRATWLCIAFALVVQSCYLAAQVLSYMHDLDSFKPDTNAYGSIYFALLAAHHAHVLVGLLLNLWLLGRLLGGLTRYRESGVRAVALYWYAVAALGVAVVATQVSPS